MCLNNAVTFNILNARWTAEFEGMVFRTIAGNCRLRLVIDPDNGYAGGGRAATVVGSASGGLVMLLLVVPET
jgi:hypothetical protein